VTGAEVVHFARVQIPAQAAGGVPAVRTISLAQFLARETVEGCPFQQGTLCTAREARPLGCRIYFCDENAQSWQQAVYEQYHAQLQAVHERFGLPYRYIEWRQALREISPGGQTR
jgi:Fe-S-cluster containining protein